MKASVCYQEGCLIVSGELNFSTVVSVWNESQPLLAKYNVLSIDLSRITSANSAALALLLEWLKYAKRENKMISFKKTPLQIQSIASVAGVDQLLQSL